MATVILSYNSLVQSETHVLETTPIENMIKVLGRGRAKLDDREVFFFAMKWMPGGSLYDRMKGISYMIYVV